MKSGKPRAIEKYRLLFKHENIHKGSLLQNTLNSTSSEIISTYVYKMGLVSSQYSLSAAIGLFNNIINLVLLLAVNFLSSKMSDTSLI